MFACPVAAAIVAGSLFARRPAGEGDAVVAERSRAVALDNGRTGGAVDLVTEAELEGVTEIAAWADLAPCVTV